MRLFAQLLLAATAILFIAGCATTPQMPTATTVTPDAMFSSNMVLQRDMKTNVWGQANPGGIVRVEIAGKTYSAEADKAGKWSLKLDPQPAGGPFEMVISGCKDKRQVFTNVIFGDVWVCSGQSNMEWSVKSSKDPAKEIASANYPKIRLLKIPHKVSQKPLTSFDAKWQVCSPKTVTHFTAVGYYFGRQLFRDLDVPIGLIQSAWGGTPAESWTTRGTLEKDDMFKPIVKRFDDGMKNYPERLKNHKKRVAAWHADNKKKNRKTRHDDPGNKGFGKGYAKLNFDDSKWKTMKLPQKWEGIMDIDGAVWFRKKVTIPADWAGKELLLQLGAVDDFDTTYFNGVQVGATDIKTPNFWQVNRKYTIPAKLVKAGPAIIAVRAFDHYGGGGFAGYGKDSMTLSLAKASSKPILISGPWRYLVSIKLDPGALFSERPPRPPMGPGHPHSPAGLYNGMINPIIPYSIKGAIWYQGESNAGRAFQYRSLLKAMITDWRREWNQGDFPFLVVQLANFMKANDQPANSAWAELREAQALAQELPNTGLAVAIDIGDANDIHPKDKQSVGKRLALAAMKIAYGQPVVYSGPSYKSMKIDGNKIILSFDHVDGGLVAKGGKLKRFAIAGKDKKFVWANAEIKGDTVVVWNDKIKTPIAVRYAWANNPEGCNLYNKADLPAVPFRTDSWPGVTHRNR